MKQLHKTTRRGSASPPSNGKVSDLALPDLYEQDETAWLEIMADLCTRNQVAELDLQNLGEYLFDIAKRDRRAVYNRLVTLLCHLLKWQYQPDKKTGSWRGTIREQRRKLRLLLDSKTLRNYAIEILHDAYSEARKQAADETELKLNTFPKECAWTIDAMLTDD